MFPDVILFSYTGNSSHPDVSHGHITIFQPLVTCAINKYLSFKQFMAFWNGDKHTEFSYHSLQYLLPIPFLIE